METIRGIVLAAGSAGLTVLGVRAVAHLGTGEKIESGLMLWVDRPDQPGLEGFSK
jgi:hypothetical protein